MKIINVMFISPFLLLIPASQGGGMSSYKENFETPFTLDDVILAKMVKNRLTK